MLRQLKIVLLISICTSGNWAQKEENEKFGFCYTEESCGPSLWPGTCSTGRRQSPITLSRKIATGTLNEPLRFNNYVQLGDLHPSVMGLHELVSTSKTKRDGGAYIDGGPIPIGHQYYLKQFHFHWGDSSEHVLEGKEKEKEKKYVGEVHFVHALDKDDDKDSKADALAVVGYFLELSQDDNPKLSNFIDLISNTSDGKTLETNNVTFDSILPDNYSKNAPYYNYEGSLTVPPCNETVMWIVMEETIKISEGQLQSYFLDHGKESTVRPAQPLNDRVLYYYDGGKKTQGKKKRRIRKSRKRRVVRQN